MASTSMHDGRVVLHNADCRDVLRGMPDNSIDSVVTDPPYALVSIVKRFGKPGSAPAKGNEAYQRASAGFMGKSWDTGEVAFSDVFWAEVLRVLKPGGHVVAFSGTRTYHRMAVAIEDAGFEIRDQLGWLYGSGFPKSHNQHGEWEGWGTALKPAWEPIALARKPLIGTVAANLAEWGVGAVNVDGCRVEANGRPHIASKSEKSLHAFGDGLNGSRAVGLTDLGRWPANIIHDGSDEVLAAFPDTKSGMMKAGTVRAAQDVPGSVVYGVYGGDAAKADTYGDSGSAARFFKTCEHDDEDWLWLNLDLSPAPTVENYSLLSSEPAYTALVRAASAALPEGLFCESLSAPPSTSATPKQLRNLVESFIAATKNIAARFLREWQQERLSQTGSLVNVVATRSPTGTTQITISHWTSSGCADPVIFNIMPKSSEVGARVFEPSMAGRFLYNPKASRADRDAGLFGAPFGPQFEHGTTLRKVEDAPKRGNIHPTVKPTTLMQWLCRLITPPGGIVLDPFMGSGSTGKGAVLEGFQFVGVEREDEYMPIATARIAWAIGASSKDELPAAEDRPVAAQAQPANDNQSPIADLFSTNHHTQEAA